MLRWDDAGVLKALPDYLKGFAKSSYNKIASGEKDTAVKALKALATARRRTSPISSNAVRTLESRWYHFQAACRCCWKKPCLTHKRSSKTPSFVLISTLCCHSTCATRYTSLNRGTNSSAYSANSKAANSRRNTCKNSLYAKNMVSFS